MDYCQPSREDAEAMPCLPAGAIERRPRRTDMPVPVLAGADPGRNRAEGEGMSDPYQTCSITKRTRRSSTELNKILTACLDVIHEEISVTLRHLFYRIVTLALIEKTEKEYRNLSGYTMKWRRNGSIPWRAFVDSTRWYHGVQTFNDLGDALENSKQCFRRNLWQSQDAYVEVWTEKEAIAAIAQQAAAPFGVPVFPMKGFGSGSALFQIAQQIQYYQSHGKEVFVYHLGDWDPSGKCIDESTVRNLKKDHGVEFNFERLAVTLDQIQYYNLPTRPTKTTDPRSKKFKGDSVEVDALAPHVIRELVTACISQHIDQRVWQRELEIEREERATFDLMAEAFKRGDFNAEVRA